MSGSSKFLTIEPALSAFFKTAYGKGMGVSIIQLVSVPHTCPSQMLVLKDPQKIHLENSHRGFTIL